MDGPKRPETSGARSCGDSAPTAGGCRLGCYEHGCCVCRRRQRTIPWCAVRTEPSAIGVSLMPPLASSTGRGRWPLPSGKGGRPQGRLVIVPGPHRVCRPSGVAPRPIPLQVAHSTGGQLFAGDLVPAGGAGRRRVLIGEPSALRADPVHPAGRVATHVIRHRIHSACPNTSTTPSSAVAASAYSCQRALLTSPRTAGAHIAVHVVRGLLCLPAASAASGRAQRDTLPTPDASPAQ